MEQLIRKLVKEIRENTTDLWQHNLTGDTVTVVVLDEGSVVDDVDDDDNYVATEYTGIEKTLQKIETLLEQQNTDGFTIKHNFTEFFSVEVPEGAMLVAIHDVGSVLHMKFVGNENAKKEKRSYRTALVSLDESDGCAYQGSWHDGFDIKYNLYETTN